MTRRFGIAIIGTGMAVMPHVRALADLSDRIAVTGVYTRTPERRAAFAAEHGLPVADSLDAIAADPATDAVLILTPPNQRLDLVRRFADAGKHILMEKPVERTLKAAEEIVDLCEAAGIHLGIVFQHRFRAASVRLKAMMDAGALGPIGTVRTDIPWWRPQSYYDEPGRGTYERDGGGVLISQAIHTLDLMLSLTGPVAEVQAVAATTRFHTMESEDFVAGGLRFANGVPGAVMATTAAYPGDPESIRIDGDKGSALLKSGTLTVRWRDGRTETHGEEASGTGGGADPMAFPHDWHRSQIAAFVDAVSAGNAPSPNGREALHVHRLIEALITSSAEKRAVTIDP